MSVSMQIVIVDDHPLFRQGVVHTLQAEADIEVVGEGASADEAIRLARDLLPDLILLDIDMPGSGLQAAAAIAIACPVTKIVMLTVSEQEEHLVAAFKAGARGYILKGVAGRELIGILRAVAAGEGYVTPSLAAGLLADLKRETPASNAASSPLDALTEREREILQLVASGYSNNETGQQLCLSEKTVKHYMTNVLQKLQVRTRVEAALLAQKGLLSPGGSG
jgi:DNA-binding NarL/FixJ family response regulator